MTQGLKPLGSFSVSALRYYYRRHAADTLIKELHAADNLEIIVLFLIHLKIAGCGIQANKRR